MTFVQLKHPEALLESVWPLWQQLAWDTERVEKKFHNRFAH